MVINYFLIKILIKVLRFYAYSEIPYIIHFYLADNTLEIREINFKNRLII